jgi:sugar diacid utilization regulator
VVVQTAHEAPPRATARAAHALELRFDELADEAVHAIVTTIPGYADATPAMLADVREHVLEHYRAFVGALQSGRVPTAEDLSFIRRHAARRVDEVPVGDFVTAFIRSQRLLWVALREVPRQSRGSQLASMDALLRYFEIAITHAAEVYVEHMDVSAAVGERTRQEVLSLLLAGRAMRPGPIAQTAEAHGLATDCPAVVLSAVTVDGSSDEQVLRAASHALAGAMRTQVPPLEVVRHDEIVVVANVAAAPHGIGTRAEGAHRQLASRGIRVVVGGSAVTPSARGLQTAYEEALIARSRAGERGDVLVLADLGAFDYLTLHRDETARRLVDDRVRTFVVEDVESGGMYVDTLEAYVACDLNVRRAAERLHVHVNTAHYRIERMATRTGLDLRNITDLMELVTAVRLYGTTAKGPEGLGT